MTEILLLHHVQGLTAGVVAFADELRRAGHVVHTPDLLDGKTFDDIPTAFQHVRSAGIDPSAAGAAAARELPADLVYAGMSLGAAPAQELAQTRPGARGALLLHGCLPEGEYGSWPSGLPAQVHAMARDPFWAEDGDRDAASALAAAHETVEVFEYDGEQHLFTDSSLPAYDAEATGLLLERVLAFLDRVG